MQKLFKEDKPSKKDTDQHKEIERLRTLARRYRDDNNALVERSWSIDQRIINSTSTEEIARLTSEKNDLSQQIQEADYLSKFDQTIEQIKQLEIAVNGHSDVGGSSPYVL